MEGARITACVLLSDEGFAFHPGPPTGPDFVGLKQIAVVGEVEAGGGAYLVNPDLEQPIPIGLVFSVCREQFHRDDIDTLDFYTKGSDHEKWSFKGSFVPPGVEETEG